MSQTIQTEPKAIGNIRAWATQHLRKNWLFCLLLAIVGFVVRIPSLQGDAVWDDDYLVRSNYFIKSPLLILEVFRHYLFPDSYSAHYRPVQNISYMADYLLWNGNFYGFHLSNILYHVTSGIFLYLLLRKLFTRLRIRFALNITESTSTESHNVSFPALLVALLWIIHPVHSAAVDYVSGRADSLAFFFGCGGWLLFLKAQEVKRLLFRCALFGLAWFSGLLALCCRENACIWLVIFLLYLFAFERSLKAWQKWAVLAACLLMFAGYFGLRQLPGPARLAGGPPSDWPPSFRVVLMMRALGDYGRLMLFPSNLHMERTVLNPAAFQTAKGRWNAIGHEYLSIAGLLVFAALILLALRRGEGQRLRIFGAVWFLIAYLPISNLIDLNSTVAEHWLYLPSVGFLIFIAGCGVDLPSRWKRAGVAFACAAIIGLGARSITRSSDWLSNETFARRTIASGGASIRVILLLGQVYSNRGDHAGAERLLRKALQLYPDYPTARNNLADALFHEGKEKEAEALLADASEAARASKNEHPRTWIAALNLAQLRHKQQDDAGAIAILEKARQDYPNTWELIGSESELLREGNKIDEALNLIRPFAENNWWHQRAWLALGRLLAQKEDVEGAASALRHASRLDVHETAALNLIAMMRMRQNRLEDAFQTQRRAVARQPDQPRQYLLLSDILDKMGRSDEARAALAHVSRLRAVADAKTTN